MAQLACTSRLESIGPVEPAVYPGSTVADVLDAAALDYPRLKRYVLDDQCRGHKH